MKKERNTNGFVKLVMEISWSTTKRSNKRQ